jgi:hypothetical protein
MSQEEFKVCASSMIATYNAGKWLAESEEEAIEMAQQDYRNSPLGQMLKDVNGFRFYIVDQFDYEENDDDENDYL